MRTLVKRWWFWAAAILLTAGITAGVVLVHSGQSKITKANFDKVQIGMTAEEVEQILGEPTQRAWDLPGENSANLWLCDVTEIMVYFDADHRVSNKDFTRGTTWDYLRYVLSKWLPTR